MKNLFNRLTNLHLSFTLESFSVKSGENGDISSEIQ